MVIGKEANGIVDRKPMLSYEPTKELNAMTSSSDTAGNCSASCNTTVSNPLPNDLMTIKEYDGLIKFIKKTADPVKCELVQFLYPLYVYIYLILLKRKKHLEARKFFSTYSQLFLNAEGYKNVIEDLFKFKNYHEPKKHSYFKNFYVNKYVIKASEDNLKLLEAYFQVEKCASLLSIIESHFQVEVVKKSDYNADSVNIDNEKDFVNESSETLENKKCHSSRNADSVNINNEKDSVNESSETLEDRNFHSSKNEDSREACNESQLELCNRFYTISCGKVNVCSADIDKDNKLLACGFENSKIYVWNIESSSMDLSKQPKKRSKKKQKTKKSKLNDERTVLEYSAELQGILKGHQSSVYGLSYSSLHDVLLSCSGDTTVRAWSTKNFETVNVYKDHEYPVWDVTVSPNGAYFATASMDFTARLWSFEHSYSLRIFTDHSSDVDCVKFHPLSKYLATASAKKVIQLWSLNDAHSVRCFTGHNSFINSIAFAPNGLQMASADDDGNIIIWDLGSGRILKTILAHTSRILNISYNKNNSFIASGGCDRFLRVWDVNFTPIKKESYSAIKRKRKAAQIEGKIDSYALKSVLHYVNFYKDNTLISVGTPAR
ncbi:hypothetical protein TNCT_707121 [Trichonephila clavata]|uniref:TFIID subunit TAF5 NTD2 domain-containing protein n=1 Tax=Trichonephila clavata TaxID=2740835 RepID=A0A8X6FQA9_TRICU|nr:hypothetical protein TNCT_707121 [Trichonephila clavata]